ncbi:hypothetical protein [Serratia sp. 2723]|uniref:hypothetical protein n=1 Tax=unclassified Serratia (in: enterobacteria) TaxID=2647522 RepID=UPI003D25437F
MLPTTRMKLSCAVVVIFYVYVLLDKKDWLGYQVTPEGFLRLFNAHEMPEGGKVESLSEACRTANHDILTGNPTVKGVDYRRVDFRVSMPGWVDGSGGWSVQLTGGGKTLFAKSDNAPETADHDQRSGPEGYDKYIWQRDGVIGEDGQEKGPWSLSLMVSVWVPASRTPEVTLTASYWPDIKDPENKLSMTINATQG